MCGICGIYDKKTESKLTTEIGRKAMLSLHHRGPDDQGEYSNNEIFLGHKRLSIIDVSSTGRQPMWSNDGRYVCVFNGEIYNFQEQREALLAKGYTFKGHSDSEVIPNLYQEFGISFIDKIKGIFSIAIYDTQTSELFLIRDRLGIKPLYYYADNGHLAFGSELKAILTDERIPRKVDHQAVYDFLSFSYIPEPATGFQNIYSLLPGHYLVYNGNKAIIKRYITNVAPQYYNSPAEAEADIKKTLEHTVKLQMVSDVNIGTFLSGGIDSSLVTAFSAKSSPTPVNSFTVKFADQAFDESYYAKIMADHVGTVYNELYIEEKTVNKDTLKDILVHFDQPFGDSSGIPTYLISRMIKDKITVALSGDGGDEFFAGYEVSWRFPFVLGLKKIPALVRHIMIAALWPLRFISSSRYRQYKKLLKLTFKEEHIILQNFFSYLNEENKKELYLDSFLKKHEYINATTRIFKDIFDNNPAEKVIEAYNKRYSLPGDMLKKVDMMSMKASIEVRVPLLYEDVIACSERVPRKWKYKFGKGKIQLRNILATEAPDEVVNKKKWGFGIPLDKSLTPDAFEFIKETLQNDKAGIYKFVRKEKVMEWLHLFFTGTNDGLTISRIGLYHRIYMLLSIELWLQKYNPVIE